MSNRDRMDLAAAVIYNLWKNAKKYEIPPVIAVFLSSLLEVLKWQDDNQEVISDGEF